MQHVNRIGDIRGLELPRGTPTLQPVSIHDDRIGFEAAHSLTL